MPFWKKAQKGLVGRCGKKGKKLCGKQKLDPNIKEILMTIS